MSATASDSTPLERDSRTINARQTKIAPSEIAIGVIIGRTSEFFDFFVYAIASVLVFPAYIFPFVDPLTGTLLSFAVFALAFFARPLGSLIFMWVDRHHGRGTKLTIALFLLGVSTVSVAFLPSYADAGMAKLVLPGRPEGRRVGNEWVSPGKHGWSP